MRRHLTFANVASLLALVFSMTGGALAARHYLINSTSQISPKVLKKLRGAQGEIGPIGPQGVTGPAGAKGSVGPRGEPYPQILVPGASESGVFGMRSSVEGAAVSQTIAFRVPLSAAIAKAQIEYGPSEHCKAPGEAVRGYLCIYKTLMSGATAQKVIDPEAAEQEGTGKLGFTLEVQALSKAASPAYEGTYTLTAP